MKNCTLTIAMLTAGIAVISGNAEDQTGPKTLSKSEITKKYDQNGDGTLDYREKMTFLRSLDENGREAYRRAFFADNQRKTAQNNNRDADWAREALERHNTSRAQITKKSNAPKTRPTRPDGASTGANPLAIFMANDKNKDGKISVKEAPERMTSGIGFTKIDSNRDGFIDKKEFMVLHSKITSRAAQNDRRDSDRKPQTRQPSSRGDDARKAWAERMKKYQEARAKAAQGRDSDRKPQTRQPSSRGDDARKAMAERMKKYQEARPKAAQGNWGRSSQQRRPSGEDIRKAIGERIKQFAQARQQMSQQRFGQNRGPQQRPQQGPPHGIIQMHQRMASMAQGQRGPRGPQQGKPSGVCPHCKRGPAPQAKFAPQRGDARGPQGHGPQRGDDRRPQGHGPQRGSDRGPKGRGPRGR
jgi:Ca2+-binding EF-hand superfamily protein